MRSIVVSMTFALASAQAAWLPGLNLPIIPILPLPGVADVLAGNGVSSIASSLTAAAQGLGVQANNIAVANAKLTGNISVSPTPNLVPSLDIVQSAASATTTLWQLATDLEKKICSIATSISQQNVAAQQANLVTAIQAQVAAVVKLQQAINGTVAAVQSQATAFSDAEKAVITSTVNAIAAAIVAASDPLVVLALGLKAIGISSLADASGILDTQVKAFATFASKVNFVGV